MLSPKKRIEVLDALRRGTVPQDGLDVLAVGLERFRQPIDDELQRAADGGCGFKAVRGEYGCGKTFFSRWLQQEARAISNSPRRKCRFPKPKPPCTSWRPSIAG